MAARARREIARAVNAEVNGVIPDLPMEMIDVSMQYILEVEFEYPREIQERDNDFQFALELLELKTELLSAKHRQLPR